AERLRHLLKRWLLRIVVSLPYRKTPVEDHRRDRPDMLGGKIASKDFTSLAVPLLKKVTVALINPSHDQRVALVRYIFRNRLLIRQHMTPHFRLQAVDDSRHLRDDALDVPLPRLPKI